MPIKLILGDGLLGTELQNQTGWKVFSRKKDGIDIRYPESYDYIFKKYSDIEIINCIGHVDTEDRTKQLHWNTNYVGVIDLVNLCNKYNVKLTHISSDFIYALSNYNTTEEDVPCAYPQWYIYTKLLSDGYVQAKSNNYLLIRTTFKKKPFPYDGAFVDLCGNFDYVDVIAEGIIKLINNNVNGVYNVGTEVKSMYYLALQTNKEVMPILKKDHYTYNINIPMNVDKFKKSIGI